MSKGIDLIKRTKIVSQTTNPHKLSNPFDAARLGLRTQGSLASHRVEIKDEPEKVKTEFIK